jgi:hypothetical protein
VSDRFWRAVRGMEPHPGVDLSVVGLSKNTGRGIKS